MNKRATVCGRMKKKKKKKENEANVHLEKRAHDTLFRWLKWINVNYLKTTSSDKLFFIRKRSWNVGNCMKKYKSEVDLNVFLFICQTEIFYGEPAERCLQYNICLPYSTTRKVNNEKKKSQRDHSDGIWRPKQGTEHV